MERVVKTDILPMTDKTAVQRQTRTAAQRSTRKGQAASVRRQSRQRLRSGLRFGCEEQQDERAMSFVLKGKTFHKRYDACGELSIVDERNAALFFCTNRATASAKPAIRGCLPLVAAGTAFPPHFFVGPGGVILRHFCVLLIIPFLKQVRTFLGDATQSFGAVRAIGAIMSTPASI